MKITKADGTQEEFKTQKLRTSLRRAGAGNNEINRIVAEIESTLTDGAHTQEIYRKAFDLLRESNDPVAAKYSLRRAVYGLGPTGFPFEDYLARLFESDGYKTRKRLILKGNCATHEVDLGVYTKTDTFVVEAKFHMQPGIKSDLQVVMYSYARFLDLRAKPVGRDDKFGISSLYVITNTKFTQAAIKYADCVGIKLISWDYPRNDSLQARIERAGVYPITVLTRLPLAQKRRLIEMGVILCVDLVKNPSILHLLGLSNVKIDAIVGEASMLCGSK